MDSCTSTMAPTKNVKAKSLKKKETPIKHILDEINMLDQEAQNDIDNEYETEEEQDENRYWDFLDGVFDDDR